MTEEATSLGLKLNHHKTEAICDDSNTRLSLRSLFPDWPMFDSSCAMLLGAPIGDLDSIYTSLRGALQKLELMGGRLSNLLTHDAMLLLRHSLAIPKHIVHPENCTLLSIPTAEGV